MMHDCRTTQEQLIDLVFQELDEPEGTRLLDEIETCADCQDQYRSMTVTLFAFDQATGNMTPGENFWPAYHERLQAQLSSAARTGAMGTPSWRQLFNTSIRVPAPIAALAVLLLFISSLFAFMRPAGPPVIEAAQPASSNGQTATEQTATERTRIVEVPMVRERVVTRTVYLARDNSPEKYSSRRRGDEGRAQDAPTAEKVQDASQTTRGPQSSVESTHAALAGFKPANEVKLRIIKGELQR